MMKKLLLFFTVAVLSFGIVRMANAALIDRGGGLIYDSDQDITWLQKPNPFYFFSISEALAWARDYEYYDSVRDVVWDDWRLPATVDGPYEFGYDGTTTAGFNITTSEMGYMYYEILGNLGQYAPDGSAIPPSIADLQNTGPFIDLWGCSFASSTAYSANPADQWFFDFDHGNQDIANRAQNRSYAWAVRDGDVAAVPIPGAICLLGSGLIGIAGLRKFRKT